MIIYVCYMRENCEWEKEKIVGGEGTKKEKKKKKRREKGKPTRMDKMSLRLPAGTRLYNFPLLFLSLSQYPFLCFIFLSFFLPSFLWREVVEAERAKHIYFTIFFFFFVCIYQNILFKFSLTAGNSTEGEKRNNRFIKIMWKWFKKMSACFQNQYYSFLM